jgi:outer membrane protein TolC
VRPGRDPALEEERVVRRAILPATLVCVLALSPLAGARQDADLPPPAHVEPSAPPVTWAPPAGTPADCLLPINLPTALHLAGVRPLDVAVAAERTEVAAAQLDRARVLWLPTLYLGVDYARHDGRIQDVAGNVFDTSKGSLMVGAGPSAVFAVSDALLAPLAARQELRARRAALQAARNDSLLAVAEAYFNVQQARGELAGSLDSARRAEAVLSKTAGLAKDIVAPVDEVRARAEAARRRQEAERARERWRLAGADLNRVLRLDPATLVEPLEPAHLRLTLIDPKWGVDDLIAFALTNRPELADRQALVQATLARLRQERLRPLVPSVLLRGFSTPVTGTLSTGVFGGGLNDSLNHFGARNDLDAQLVWVLEDLGFGNAARVRERAAENRLALLELFRTQDRVAAEVAQSHAQARSAAARLADAEAALRDAVESADLHLKVLGETQKVGTAFIPIIRPQEATAAVQALAQAYADYYGAVADHNRAQFRLYHALGEPAEALTCPPGHGPRP